MANLCQALLPIHSTYITPIETISYHTLPSKNEGLLKSLPWITSEPYEIYNQLFPDSKLMVQRAKQQLEAKINYRFHKDFSFQTEYTS